MFCSTHDAWRQLSKHCCRGGGAEGPGLCCGVVPTAKAPKQRGLVCFAQVTPTITIYIFIHSTVTVAVAAVSL